MSCTEHKRSFGMWQQPGEHRFKRKADSLNIMVWEGTWSEEMFQDFTKETGIKVNISYIDNTDTLLAKMIEGSADYDLIDLEGAYVNPFGW